MDVAGIVTIRLIDIQGVVKSKKANINIIQEKRTVVK